LHIEIVWATCSRRTPGNSNKLVAYNQYERLKTSKPPRMDFLLVAVLAYKRR